MKQIGKNATGVQGDVSNLKDLDRLYETVKKEKGHIGILFANAGLGEFAPLIAVTEEHFDKTFGVNVKGVPFSVQKRFRCFAKADPSFSTPPLPARKRNPPSAFMAPPKRHCARSCALGRSN